MRQIWGVLCLVVFASCSPLQYYPQHAYPIPPYKCPDQPVAVALVLGGGGARGLAHVGVIEELEQEGIPIDVIVASSAGAIVGALYADCPNGAYLKDLLYSLKSTELLDFHILNSRYGFVNGTHLRSFLCQHLGARYFEDLRIPLIVVATDLCHGEEICLGAGPLIPAVHASCAVPGLFKPVCFYRRILVDGAVIAPVPVEVARDYGAEIVIAVDINEMLPEALPKHLWGVFERSLQISYTRLSDYTKRGADVVIQPHLKDIGLLNDKKNPEIYEAGRAAARAAMPQIKRLLSARKEMEEALSTYGS